MSHQTLQSAFVPRATWHQMGIAFHDSKLDGNKIDNMSAKTFVQRTKSPIKNVVNPPKIE